MSSALFVGLSMSTFHPPAPEAVLQGLHQWAPLPLGWSKLKGHKGKVDQKVRRQEKGDIGAFIPLTPPWPLCSSWLQFSTEGHSPGRQSAPKATAHSHSDHCSSPCLFSQRSGNGFPYLLAALHNAHTFINSPC